jgi:hypothetical protein
LGYCSHMAQITGLNWTVDHLVVHFRKATAHRKFTELRGNEYLLETKPVLGSNSTVAVATVPEIPPRSRILSDCATVGNFILSPIIISIAPRGYSYYKISPSAEYPAQNSGVGICKRYRNRNSIRLVCVSMFAKIADYNVCTDFPTIYNSPRRLT